jgi:lipopolysaccharide export system protein LptC
MMAQSDPDLHSRVVGMAKIILPLVALAALSSLFLFARVIDPDMAIPYADVDVDAYARDPRLTAPTYAGTTQDGAMLTLTADEARPAADGATAAGVLLTLQREGAGETRVAAATAAMSATHLDLAGGVRITTPNGTTVAAEALRAALDRTEMVAGPVTATGPLGALSAQAMRLDRRDGAEVLDFTGGVSVLYLPPQSGASVP